MEIEQRANGKYRCRIWDETLGRKVNVGTFAVKADARRAGLAAEAELRRRGFVKERLDITFGDLCDRYLGTLDHLRADTSRKWYENALKPARVFFGESASIRRMRKEQVQSYVAALIRSGRSRKTVCSYVKVLRMLLEQAIDWEYREDNPAKRLRNLPRNERSDEAIRVLTPAEHARLVSHAPAEYAVMFEVWPFVGLRRSEMQGLTLDNVFLDGNYLRVEAQLRDDGRLDRELKTAQSRRVVVLSDRVVQLLRQHILASKPNDLNLVFPTRRGLPQSCRSHFYKVWRKACSAADLEGVNPHAMRHTFITWCLAAGANPNWVAKQAGHAKASITLDIYGHLLPNADAEAGAKVEKWYNQQPAADGQGDGSAPILPQAGEDAS